MLFRLQGYILYSYVTITLPTRFGQGYAPAGRRRYYLERQVIPDQLRISASRAFQPNVVSEPVYSIPFPAADFDDMALDPSKLKVASKALLCPPLSDVAKGKM